MPCRLASHSLRDFARDVPIFNRIAVIANGAGRLSSCAFAPCECVGLRRENSLFSFPVSNFRLPLRLSSRPRREGSASLFKLLFSPLVHPEPRRVYPERSRRATRH